MMMFVYNPIINVCVVLYRQAKKFTEEIERIKNKISVFRAGIVFDFLR